MRGFGALLDAHWTDINGNKIGQSIAAPEEITQIIPSGSAEVVMVLQFPKAFYDEDPENKEAGLLNIRTWKNLPAALLDLPDINIDLDLNALPNEVVADPTSIPLGVYHSGNTFSVSLGMIEDEFIGPEYESLLYADIQNAGQIIGRFWNINPQSPEPATLVLLSIGGAAMLRRKRRTRA